MIYVKVKPSLWTGQTGKAMRQFGPEVRELAIYLISNQLAVNCPEGLYHIDAEMMALQTGRDEGTIRKSLRHLEEIGYLRFDEASSWLWVVEMAAHQFDAPLKGADYRVKTVKRWYAAAPKNPFLGPFYDRYVLDLRLGLEPDPVERRDYAPHAEGAPIPAVSPLPMIPAPALVGEAEQLFTELVHIYPKPSHLKQAREVWFGLRPTRELLMEIAAALAWQRQQQEWLEQGGRMIPRLAAYLRDERWKDQPTKIPTITPKNADTLRAGEAFVAGATQCNSTPPRTVKRSAAPSRALASPPGHPSTIR